MGVLSDIFAKGIKEKEIYYFSSTKIGTAVPHHYICIKRNENDVLVLAICTSKFETVRKFVETRKLPTETLVYIPSKNKDAESPFPLDTYVNCNDAHPYTVDEFKRMFESKTISVTGIIPDDYYVQIIIGLHKSPMIDNEIKAAIPNPESI